MENGKQEQRYITRQENEAKLAMERFDNEVVNIYDNDNYCAMSNEASCIGKHKIFFSAYKIKAAKSICDSCPVIRNCAAFWLQHLQTNNSIQGVTAAGIWFPSSPRSISNAKSMKLLQRILDGK